MILTADIHLTDNLAETYRWRIFDTLRLMVREKKQDIFILGDLCEKKDRHSAELVNHMVVQLETFAELGADVHIMMGNHDKPKRGVPFWNFLSHIPGVHFYHEPAEFNEDVLLLPFAEKPEEAWAELDLDAYKLVFMHQPINGAVAQSNGHTLEGEAPLPEISEGVRVYAGDVHIPQRLMLDGTPITYIGAPHPIHFGDTYQPRVITLDPKREYRERVVKIDTISRYMLDVVADGPTFEPPNIRVREGDQARVRVHVPLKKMDAWPAARDAMVAWAKKVNLNIFSLEPVVEMGERAEAAPLTEELNDPQEVLKAFAEQEGLDEDLVATGLGILGIAMEGKRRA